MAIFNVTFMNSNSPTRTTCGNIEKKNTNHINPVVTSTNANMLEVVSITPVLIGYY